MSLLPPIPGPKIGPFPLKRPTDLTFLETLGDGLHSAVYKVEISGKLYALKVVSSISSQISIVLWRISKIGLMSIV